VGCEFGQTAVYYQPVEYDVEVDEW
jgi:hypothetical protein